MLESLQEWDKEFFIFLNNLGTERYDSFWIFITQIESWIPLFILFIILVFYYYRGKKGLFVFLSVALTFYITLSFTEITKDCVTRLRPNNDESLSGLIRVLQDPSSYSFFSGHASTSFAITTFVVLALRKFNKWIYLAYLWPLLFVSSRIYVGVHYPSDILAGAFVGFLMAILCYRLSMRLLPKL
jgi:undecaprenyl-diphosphatase